ncbi:uncharacterized protein At5g01610-like [Cannabis sativa]|uniref:uncharacterized protein At5g01610-like n=1 Tax=Cannabis sativa TaxID=3483 RepID=UPI0029CA8292|nr:uncharacterized protein At5g01610-like [Cannabis sativa]
MRCVETLVVVGVSSRGITPRTTTRLYLMIRFNFSIRFEEFLREIIEAYAIILNNYFIREKAKWIFNKLKGSPPKTLPDLLREYNLPPGLFPQNITCYEFDETKARLIVYLPSPCEVSFKDSSVIRYANRVKAILLRGKLTGIEGMKTKVLVWVKVTCVAVESSKSDKVWFTAGVKKSRSKDAYLVASNGVRIEDF